LSPLDDRTGVGETSADNHEKNRIANLEAAGASGFIKRDGNGVGVAVFIKVGMEFIRTQIHSVRHGFDNSQIRRLRNYTRDVVGGDAATLEDDPRCSHHGGYGWV